MFAQDRSRKGGVSQYDDFVLTLDQLEYFCWVTFLGSLLLFFL